MAGKCIWRSIGTLGILASACASFSASPISLLTKPVLIGQPDGDCFPLLVAVQNTGPDTHGEVTIEGSGVTVHYPIELPHGSLKSFIAYPPANTLVQPMRISLQTTNGNLNETWTNPSDGLGAKTVLVIGDNPGSASFLKTQATESSGGSLDLYADPKILPERGEAYGNIGAVILADGAERMSDTAVQALKEYVMAGGELVFFGGAAPRALRDPRWAALCPVSAVSTETVDSLKVDTKRQGVLLNSFPVLSQTSKISGVQTELAGPITIASGVPATGAIQTSRKGSLQTVIKSYGCGTVIYCAANPFEGGFSASPQRGAVVRSVLGFSHLIRRFITKSLADEITPHSDQGSGYTYSTTTYYGPGGATVSGSPAIVRSGLDIGADPFHVQLPAVEVILLILLGYFVIVAPINLLVLRKLGRGQWAWVTAPAISIAFAAVFFRFASGLYHASESKQVFSCIVADASGGPNYLDGYAQLFFPSGGSYDLRLANVQSFTSGPEGGGGYDPYSRNAPVQPLDEVDSNGVQVPAFSTTNLSFSQFNFAGYEPNLRWVKADVSLENGNLIGTITNVSNYVLTGCRVAAEGKSYDLEDLAPGQTKSVRSSGDSVLQENITGVDRLSGDRMLFGARVEGFEAGPQVGATTTDSITKLVVNLGSVK